VMNTTTECQPVEVMPAQPNHRRAVAALAALRRAWQESGRRPARLEQKQMQADFRREVEWLREVGVID
jgi:hypothetical protein